MPTYSVNLSTNKFAIAEEVIASAVKILLTAGFEGGEVSSLMRQAADQLESGDAVGIEPSERQNDPDDETISRDEPDLYDLFERYEQIPERKSLGRLSKRASALGYADKDDDLKKAFEILEQSLPLAEAALNWIIQECSQAGIRVEPHKDEWLEKATDEELDHEEEIVFLDDWQVNGDFQLNQIAVLSRSFAHSGDLNGFGRLVELIRSHKVIYGLDDLAEIERTADALETMASFKEFLARYHGSGELMQSAILDQFVLESGFSGGTYMLDGWLDSLSKTGFLQRYKRSNRWRIVL
jgi:hypothetical protein